VYLHCLVDGYARMACELMVDLHWLVDGDLHGWLIVLGSHWLIGGHRRSLVDTITWSIN
jgi:hypothetical protein